MEKRFGALYFLLWAYLMLHGQYWQHAEVTETPLHHGLQMSLKDAEYPLLSLATVGMEVSIAKLCRIVSQQFNLFANHFVKSRQQPHPIVMLLHKTVSNVWQFPGEAGGGILCHSLPSETPQRKKDYHQCNH